MNKLIKRLCRWLKELIYFEAPEIDEDWIEERRQL